ncbi:MAG TPA: hypothetical protein VGV92_06925 [Gammaproteobacteria bacterium]|nr:hypothetical protein [Gammaproteobacteria bacterium]
MEERRLDEIIYAEITAPPERGFQGLLKGFMFAMTVVGALDIFRIMPITPETQTLTLKLSFGCALIGFAWGLQNEQRRVDIIFNEHAANGWQRFGLFGHRALVSRAPQTIGEGLAKGLMFSTTCMIFTANHLETSTILKVIVAATVLGGMWGARNEMRR